MAHAILTGLNAPALVSSVEIDAGASRAKATDCSVEKLEASKTAVTFTRTDNSLPLPVQADWVSLLPYVNQLNDLNHYGIKVSGLEAGTYTLSIDGTAVGKFSDSQLAEGVNLGNLTTGPIHDQGQKVFNAINEKNKIVHGRFRNVVMFLAPDWLIETSTPVRNRELTKRMDKVSEIQAEIYKLVQPVPHQFVLKAAK